MAKDLHGRTLRLLVDASHCGKLYVLNKSIDYGRTKNFVLQEIMQTDAAGAEMLVVGAVGGQQPDQAGRPNRL